MVTSVVNRYYDPSTDQLLSVDPAVTFTGQPYVFTNDNPLNATDPLGLCWVICSVVHAVASGFDDTRHAVASAGKLVVKYRDTIAGVLAVATCIGFSLGACAVATAVALGVREVTRVQKDGFRKSLGANISDAIFTVGSFGLVRIPLTQDLSGFTGYQKAIVGLSKAVPNAIATFWRFEAK